MYDFFQLRERYARDGHKIIEPFFQVVRTEDLMTRGKDFYAIWNEERSIWVTDPMDALELIDRDILNQCKEFLNFPGVEIRLLKDFDNGKYEEFQKYLKLIPQNYHELDRKITFLNDESKKDNYVSKKVPYNLKRGDISNYDTLMDVLYDDYERRKIEWCIGAVLSGEAKNIQKFLVLYGQAGTGKSTVLNIMQKLFEGYFITFDAKELTSQNNLFSMEQFRSNPLVAIQHDGDLSRIEDNTKLNSIVSHEYMSMNEKYKQPYTIRLNCFLFMATNKPVKITDSKSGIYRRLIDVKPSGRRISDDEYLALVNGINYEIGAIAAHCLDVFEECGRLYYNNYVPIEMAYQTNPLFNFVETFYDDFSKAEYIQLTTAYDLYKKYCDDSFIEHKMPRYKFREELKAYFKRFESRYWDGESVKRSCYLDFNKSVFMLPEFTPVKLGGWIELEEVDRSLFDDIFEGCKAQYASKYETPKMAWDECNTKLMDIDTRELHYVKPPDNLIVIDFDLKNSEGEKDYELNLSAANKWPRTYCETSKGGSGIHLHYFYDGDVSKLSSLVEEGIEIKTFTGKSSLRRRLTKATSDEIMSISSGLPLKGEKNTMVDFEGVKSEKALRTLIQKNLDKEYHPGTKPSVDFIKKILDDAYKSGMIYDVTDLQPKVLAFANNSSNHAEYCVEQYMEMKFKSEEQREGNENYDDDILIFYDVEVFPNLFVVVYKKDGEGNSCIRMINPSPVEIEELCKFKLVGFNNRRYDNHILYARMLGYSEEQLYSLSSRIVSNDKKNSDGLFSEAYNLSYADVYDFAAKKQGLKKWEIELGIHHQELGLPWDEPVDPKLWDTVAEYCENDVVATEVVFHHLEGDFAARQFLAELTGGSVNDTTNSLTTKLIFGRDRNPQSEFNYVDLSEMFPGYKFDAGKSYYRGEETGEGGYVYAEPGMYTDVALLDIASMHPSSIIAMNMFGDKYTAVFKELVQARLACKHKDRAAAERLLGGMLIPFFDKAEVRGDGSIYKNMTLALKIAINSVYGLTSAKFPNAFKDPRNVDNIVAKRGALFMIDLKHAVQEKGFTVAHIKTDSIKIPNATEEIIAFCMEFGEKYGYTFEHEDTYKKMCLVNDAVYIAKDEEGWTATGKQFAVPYVFKTLFTKEKVIFKDMCVTMASKTGPLYLDFNEGDEENHNYQFVGNVGEFVPIAEGYGGGMLYCKRDEKYVFPPGAKGYRWCESEMAKQIYNDPDETFPFVDKRYFAKLLDEAAETISKYGDITWFTSDDEVEPKDDFMNVPEVPDGEAYELPWDNSDGLTKTYEKGEELNG